MVIVGIIEISVFVFRKFIVENGVLYEFIECIFYVWIVFRGNDIVGIISE